MATYKTLRVYQSSYQLAIRVHRLSLLLPKLLQYDLADQLRRASRSIPSNIAEGFARCLSKQDTARFVAQAAGSNEEVLFNLLILKDLGLLSPVLFEELTNQYVVIGKQLKRLVRHLRSTS